MTQKLSLNDGWQVVWADYGGENPPAEPEHPSQPIPASVPGVVQADLVREGLLPELYRGENLDHALWVEWKDWWYRRSFATPPDLGDRKAQLVFHGLDTFATVWLNGQEVGRADNMFIRHAFDVTGLLRSSGLNELTVRLASPAHSIQVDGRHRPLVWSPERLFARKAQMSFGWDIAPRLVTVGIWRPVELELTDTARIADVRVRHEAPGGARLRAWVEVEVQWLARQPGRGRLSGRIHQTGFEWSGELVPGSNLIAEEVILTDPPLWWPIGYGRPELCEVEVRLESGGRQLDLWRSRVGIRRIELVCQGQPSGAESFRFRCNGRDIFITGLNYTPLDAVFPAVTPQRITQTLEALAGIGCNMLRVWGGGVYESRHFYDECDRLGILIWQDFMMACGWYPQTDEFADKLAAEARQVVRELRGHACIAIWSGDNENDAFYPELMSQNRLTREVLADICRELDGDTPYVPSSPYSPSGADPQSQREGDMHYYAHGQSYRDCPMWGLRCRFMSEFGHLSLPSAELIRRYFPPGTEWPLSSRTWRYHAADTIRTCRFRGADRILASLSAVGRPVPEDLEEAVAASQELQAEAVCAWIDKWCQDPEFAGFLVWNVGDCWPQQSDSVMEYGGKPKLVFERLGPLFARVRRQYDARADQH